MISIAEILSDTYYNSHTVRNILFIITICLMLVVIEMLSAVPFASQRETYYKIDVLTYIKRMFEWNTLYISNIFL
jgi:hypothetical protein